jgi:Tfp pilus assembly protein PilO
MKVNKIIIYAVCGLFVLSLLFLFFATAYASIDNVSAANLEHRLVEYEKKAQEASKLEASRNQWRNVHKVFEKFKDDHLLKMDEYSQFRSKLRVIFMKNRLQVLAKKKVNHQYRGIFKDFLKVSITFTLSGTYPDFKRFIHEMNSQDYKKNMVLFRKIQLHKTDQGSIRGEFWMEVYLAK